MTRPRRFLGPVAPVLASLLLATAAGSAAAPRAAPAPSWARKVCSAIGPWLDTLEQSSAKAAGSTGNAAHTRRTLRKLLKDAEKATATAQKKLGAAGTPAAPRGKQIAKIVKSAFGQVGRTITQARKGVDAAKPRGAASFLTAIRSAQDGLESGLESEQQALATARDADAPSLVSAFAGEGSCTRPVQNAATPGVTLDPNTGPPGIAVVVAPSNVDAAAADQCYGSSAFAIEVLNRDGTILGTGGETVDVPATATPGRIWVRLVCYLPDATGRRVIHGLCAPFTVTGGAAPGTESAATDASCPPTPRLVLSQGVLTAETTLSQGFNPVVAAIG